VAQILLDAGVNIDAKANVCEQSTSLHLAAMYGPLDMVEAQIKAGANLNSKDR
jgi:ankyrin repeat protein